MNINEAKLVNKKSLSAFFKKQSIPLTFIYHVCYLVLIFTLYTRSVNLVNITKKGTYLTIQYILIRFYMMLTLIMISPTLIPEK